jgi:hypothetical protein
MVTPDDDPGFISTATQGLAGPIPVPGSKASVSGTVYLNRDGAAQLPPGYGFGPTLGKLALHEITHVIGLAHSGSQQDLMYPFLGNNPGGYGPGDIAGLAHVGAGTGCVDLPPPAPDAGSVFNPRGIPA